jgi:conjugal transfer mating pair stabilization protein TraN
MCSTKECFNQDQATEIGDPQGSNDKEDDGQYDENGGCLGQIYIFNGKDNRCRTAGVTTVGRSCCSNSDYLLGISDCKDKEIKLAGLKDEKKCHYIGKYCSKEINVGFDKICIEHKKSYCCFDTILSRILHEQGRGQIPNFTWGSAKSPECRGFTPEEFTRLNFDKINLNEFVQDIETKTASEVKNDQASDMTDSIQNYYDNTPSPEY